MNEMDQGKARLDAADDLSGRRVFIIEDLQHAPVLQKPYQQPDLERALRAALRVRA
jgi:hypothetical protein